MNPEELRSRIEPGEIRFTASRSGGPGGQNVNKVNTRVELRFNVSGSHTLTDSEKETILKALGNRITTEGDLIIISQSERSQLQNRKKAESTFFRLVSRALTPRAVRKPTKPTNASRIKRVDEKKKRGAIKALRKDLKEND